jgi:hypothetical protein
MTADTLVVSLAIVLLSLRRQLQLHSSPSACDKLFRLIAITHSGDRNMTGSVCCRYPGGDCTSDIWLVDTETN